MAKRTTKKTAVKPIPMGKYIRYDRETRDYAMYLNGELIGFARNYQEAEDALNEAQYKVLTIGQIQD